MRKIIAVFALGLGLGFGTPNLLLGSELPLQLVEVKPQGYDLGRDEQLWGSPGKPGDRQRLLRAINYSLRYLNTNSAVKAYQNYPVPGITRDRVRRSLIRFRELLLYSRTPVEFQRAVEREFVFYQSVGHDNQGTVSFTGYFVPVYSGSRKPTPEYRYPLYRKPRDFDNWGEPHPTRAELEGEDGLLGKQSPLSGSELVWLRDRLEAFLIQVQGICEIATD